MNSSSLVCSLYEDCVDLVEEEVVESLATASSSSSLVRTEWSKVLKLDCDKI